MRRATVCAALVATFLAALTGCADKPSPPQPAAARAAYNLLLVTLDTTRADHLGAYGYDQGTSAAFDALAADAAQFDFAISTAGLTPIAHASIFTGLNPYKHGVRVMYGPAGHYLSATLPTLAKLLKDKGYATGGFVSAYPASEKYGMHWGFDTFENGMEEGAVDMDPSEDVPQGLIAAHGRWIDAPVGTAQRRADSTTDQAIDWLKKAAADAKPFFQWVHYFDPHDPWLIPPKDVMDRFGVDRRGDAGKLKVYDADIYFMDQQFGRLLQQLKDCGKYDNTVIIVTADHGQGLEDHDWFRHRILYQEQIHIPLIIRLPDGPRGKRFEALVRNVDILPTLGEVLGFAVPENIDGSSFMGLLAGKPEPPRMAYAEALNTEDISKLPSGLPERHKDLLFCVMDRDWKLIYHKHRPENSELYDLRNDPKELKNVIEQEVDQRNRLMQILEKTGGLTIHRNETSPIDEETRKRLEALGYLGGDDGG